MVLKANFISLARCLRQFLVSKASANKWIRNVWTSAQLTDAENKNEKGLFLSLQTCCVCLQRICFLFDSNYENSNSLKKCCFELEQNPLFNGKICASELFSPVKSRVDWEFWFIDRNISFSFFLVDFQRNTFVSSYRGEIDIFRGNSDLLPESLTWNFHLLPIPGTFVSMVPWWTFV